MKTYVLYNPLAGNGRGRKEAEKLRLILKDTDLIYIDMTKISSYPDLFASFSADDQLVLCGGDGTLNRFINETEKIEMKNSILYYASGSGNDFLRDLGKKAGSAPFHIDRYLKELPTVTVKGKNFRFLNGIGYGIDGYCCEEADRQRRTRGKSMNYILIALKGLIYAYRPVDMNVTVDGKEYAFRKVWMAPAMKGRFYGGGAMSAPSQDRLHEDGIVTLAVVHNLPRFKTFFLVPTVFIGWHVKFKKYVTILTGHDIRVEAAVPQPLQIDGETFLDVPDYHVVSKPKRS